MEQAHLSPFQERVGRESPRALTADAVGASNASFFLKFAKANLATLASLRSNLGSRGLSPHPSFVFDLPENHARGKGGGEENVFKNLRLVQNLNFCA